MKTSEMLLALLLFSSILIGISTFTVDLAESSGQTITDPTSSFTQLSEIQTRINETCEGCSKACFVNRRRQAGHGVGR